MNKIGNGKKNIRYNEREIVNKGGRLRRRKLILNKLTTTSTPKTVIISAQGRFRIILLLRMISFPN